MKKDLKRYDGIDIIKIVAIIFVPILHFYLNYDFGKINMLHFTNVIEIMIRWISFSCIGLFLMSSGYLLSNKKIKKGYYLKIFYFLLLYGITLAMQHTVVNRFGSNYILDYFTKFFQFSGYFWYVSFYICLYTLIPYMNLVIEKMNKKSYLIFLVTLIILTSQAITLNSIPHYFPIRKVFFLPGSFCVLWPATYYYIGAFYRKFEVKINKYIYVLMLLVSVLFISILNFIYSNKGPAFFTGGGYGNFVSVIITTCIFGLLYKINLKTKLTKKVVKFCASITFETYLSLAMSDVITRKIINHLANYKFVEYKYIIIEAPLNFAIAFIIGIFIHYFAKLIMRIINSKNLRSVGMRLKGLFKKE